MSGSEESNKKELEEEKKLIEREEGYPYLPPEGYPEGSIYPPPQNYPPLQNFQSEPNPPGQSYPGVYQQPPYEEPTGQFQNNPYQQPGVSRAYPQQPMYQAAMLDPQRPLLQNYGFELKNSPTHVICPSCSYEGLTQCEYNSSPITWCCCICLFCIGCTFGCCLIPFCINECKDCTHRCSNCGFILGEKTAIG